MLTHKGKYIRFISDTLETLKTRKVWSDIFQAQRISNCQPRLLYPEKILLELAVTFKVSIS
jgi:hypothetical protein